MAGKSATNPRRGILKTVAHPCQAATATNDLPLRKKVTFASPISSFCSESGDSELLPSQIFKDYKIFPIVVVLNKDENGFGFNVVGGTDDYHLPEVFDAFVSQIRPDGVAARNGQLSVGDRIIAVNGCLTCTKSHDEICEMFRGIDTAVMVVEKGAEMNIITHFDPPPLFPFIPSFSMFKKKKNINGYLDRIVEATSGRSSPNPLVVDEEEEDAAALSDYSMVLYSSLGMLAIVATTIIVYRAVRSSK